MMGKMRDLTKWVLYILILAFVGLMVVEWGADYSGLIQQQESVVGEVEGEEIPLQMFNIALSNARAAEENRTGNSLDEAAMSQLRDQVWEELVQRIVLRKELVKMNIKVTDDDVSNYILNMLTQQYSNDPNFQTNGQFDQSKLTEALSQPDNRNLLINMELQAKESLPYAKLVDFINASVIVTEQELRDEFAQTNVKSKIDFLGVPSTAFRNDSVTVTDADIQKYYNAHKDEYKLAEMRKLKYIFISKTPTKEDSAHVYEVINELKVEAESGKDFATLALTESEDPTAQNNSGDLGYFDRQTMVKEFADAAFDAKSGSIVGPVKTRFGLHIIKVVDKKVEDGKEKVRASHILKRFEAGIGTIDEANGRANDFITELEGQDFETVAGLMDIEVQETAPFIMNANGQIPGAGRVSGAVNWAFSNEEGAVSEAYYTDNGNYIFKIEEVKPAGFRPLVDVKDAVKRRVENEKRLELAKALASTLVSRVQSGESFAQIAQGDEKITADTTDFFTKNVFVPKIGRAPELIAKAFSMPVGEVSGMIETERGYYFIRVKDRIDFDEAAFTQQKSSLRNRLLQQKSRAAFGQWYTALKDKATIVDQRYRFYRG